MDLLKKYGIICWLDQILQKGVTLSQMTPGLADEIRAFVLRRQPELSSSDGATVVLDDGTTMSRSAVCNAAARFLNNLGPDSVDAAADGPAYRFIERVMAGVLVVQAQTVSVGDDPAIKVFYLTVTYTRGEWKEVFGSRELLQACLKGMTMLLGVAGYHGHLAWHLPETFHEPSGVRWTFVGPGELAEMEELDSEGNVCSID